jgi:hypothetical protein
MSNCAQCYLCKLNIGIKAKLKNANWLNWYSPLYDKKSHEAFQYSEVHNSRKNLVSIQWLKPYNIEKLLSKLSSSRKW